MAPADVSFCSGNQHTPATRDPKTTRRIQKAIEKLDEAAPPSEIRRQSRDFYLTGG